MTITRTHSVETMWPGTLVADGRTYATERACWIVKWKCYQGSARNLLANPSLRLVFQSTLTRKTIYLIRPPLVHSSHTPTG